MLGYLRLACQYWHGIGHVNGWIMHRLQELVWQRPKLGTTEERGGAKTPRLHPFLGFIDMRHGNVVILDMRY